MHTSRIKDLQTLCCGGAAGPKVTKWWKSKAERHFAGRVDRSHAPVPKKRLHWSLFFFLRGERRKCDSLKLSPSNPALASTVPAFIPGHIKPIDGESAGPSYLHSTKTKNTEAEPRRFSKRGVVADGSNSSCYEEMILLFVFCQIC